MTKQTLKAVFTPGTFENGRQLNSPLSGCGSLIASHPEGLREAIGVQLSRMGYSSPFEWVDITTPRDPETDDPADDDVREVYLSAVLRWRLPIDTDVERAIRRFFVPEYIARFEPLNRS